MLARVVIKVIRVVSQPPRIRRPPFDVVNLDVITWIVCLGQQVESPVKQGAITYVCPGRSRARATEKTLMIATHHVLSNDNVWR